MCYSPNKMILSCDRIQYVDLQHFLLKHEVRVTMC